MQLSRWIQRRFMRGTILSNKIKNSKSIENTGYGSGKLYMCITETYLVDPDHHNLTGLYYQAMHNCHADFLGKDLFDYQVDDDGDDCRVPKKSFSPFEPYRTHI